MYKRHEQKAYQPYDKQVESPAVVKQRVSSVFSVQQNQRHGAFSIARTMSSLSITISILCTRLMLSISSMRAIIIIGAGLSACH